jgi:hypothetical protein
MAKDPLKEVLDRVQTWPPQRQEEAVRMLLALEAREDEVYLPGDDDWTAVAEGLAQAKRDETVSDDEIAALFKPPGA